MVRVPLPQQPQQSTSIGGFSAPNVVGPGPGAGGQLQQTGEALRRAGVVAAKIADDAQDRLYVAQVKEAQALAEERLVDADLAYRSKVGKAATGLGREQAWADLQKQLSGIENSVADETPRKLFRQVLDQRLLQTRAVWGRHEAEQLRVYEIGSGTAVLAAKMESARRQGLGAEDDLLATVEVEARSLAAKKGYSPAEIAQAVLAATSGVVAGRVEDAADAGDGTGASDYLERMNAKVDAKTLGQLRRTVRRASVREQGARLAVDLREQIERDHEQEQIAELTRDLDEPALLVNEVAPLTATRLQNEGLRRAQVMFENGGISIEVRDAAIAEIAAQARAAEAREVEARDTTAREAEQFLIDNPMVSVEGLPPALYERARSLGLLPTLNSFSGSAGRYSTDREFLTTLFLPGGGGLFQMSQAQFVSEARRRLDPQDFRTAVALYLDANQQPTEGYAGELTEADMIREAARKLEILPRGKGIEAALASEAFFNFRADISARAKQAKAQTREELQKIINVASQDKVYLDQIGSDPERSTGTLTDEEQDIAYVTPQQTAEFYRSTFGIDAPLPLRNAGPVRVGNIQRDVRDAIVERLLDSGLPVTSTSVVAWWVLNRRPKTVDEVLRR